jgi:hypothetical protein
MLNNTLEQNLGLDSIIKESKNEIENEVKKKEAKRGRPKKEGSTIDKKSTSQPFTNPTLQPMSKDQYKSVLGGVIQMANVYLNKYTETELFTMTKEEYDMVTDMGAQTMLDFMPAVNPIYMNAIGFGCILAGVYGMKYQAYKDHVKTLVKNKDVVAEVKK